MQQSVRVTGSQSVEAIGPQRSWTQWTFGVIGGIWVYLQYREATRLRAADTLLKVEEEFRHVLPFFERIEDINTYTD